MINFSLSNNLLLFLAVPILLTVACKVLADVRGMRRHTSDAGENEVSVLVVVRTAQHADRLLHELKLVDEPTLGCELILCVPEKYPALLERLRTQKKRRNLTRLRVIKVRDGSKRALRQVVTSGYATRSFATCVSGRTAVDQYSLRSTVKRMWADPTARWLSIGRMRRLPEGSLLRAGWATVQHLRAYVGIRPMSYVKGQDVASGANDTHIDGIDSLDTNAERVLFRIGNMDHAGTYGSDLFRAVALGWLVRASVVAYFVLAVMNLNVAALMVLMEGCYALLLVFAALMVMERTDYAWRERLHMVFLAPLAFALWLVPVRPHSKVSWSFPVLRVRKSA